MKGPEERGDLLCSRCGGIYPFVNGIPSLLPETKEDITEEIQKFWGTLYEYAYEEKDRLLTPDRFPELLGRLQELFSHREHLAVNEMPIQSLSGLRVLEIGSGAGSHSALFSHLGAAMVSLDLTAERVSATASKLDLLDSEKKDFALQGDAGYLPFPDESFDIVYSNGVLHHTPYIEKTVDEIHRVLKPGGKAVIMLYAKDSFLYYCVLLPIRGILMGGFLRGQNWLGRATEWMSDKKQEIFNPRTEVFSSSELQKMFATFRNVSLRKNSFVFDQIPIVGKVLGRLAGLKTGYNPAGALIYGFPWRNETRLELWLGRFVGFAWNISAEK